MKQIRFAVLLVVPALLASAAVRGQSWQWATKPIGLASTNFDDNGVASVALDNFDNSFVVGQFNDSATFGGIKMKSVNGLDMYIAKLDGSGSLQWVRTVGGGSETDLAVDVTTDPLGNAYMAGFFGDSLSFGGTVVRIGTQSSVAIAKYNSAGDLKWARLATGLSIGTTGGVAYSPTGHLYLGCGHALGKYTLDGDSVWTWQVPILGNVLSINDVAVDAAGDYIYVTGYFANSVDFGTTTLNSGSLSNYDIFVAKFDKDGNVIWAKQAGGAGTIWIESGNGITVDHNGNVYVCGQFTQTAHFDADSISTGSSLWSMFLAKYGSTGSLEWVRGDNGGGSTYSSAADVRLVSNETAVLVGASFAGSADFADSTFSIVAGSDALLTKVSSSGTVLWGEQSGSTTAIIFVNGMDVNRATSEAVMVGYYTNMSCTFTPFVLPAPTGLVGDGWIAGSSTDSPTPVDDRPETSLPNGLSLSQNYPNPFNPSTTIAFDLPTSSHVTITVFNVLGQRVRTLLDDRLDPGPHTVVWNGRDDHGDQAPTGVYLYRLEAGNKTEARKMLLLK